MKILVAPNSFKESLTSHDIARRMRIGLKRASTRFHVTELPLADGGTGTCRVLTNAFGGRLLSCLATGPRGHTVSAAYGVVPHNNIAIIELAQAAGLSLLPKNKRNPLVTTTKGVGELMSHVLKKGYKKIILGIGDSATIDCGAGALSVLGFRFLTKKNKEIEQSCRGLLNLDHIDSSRVRKEAGGVRITIGSDVENILTGRNGALVYARQKGATKSMLPLINRALKNFRKVILRQYRIDLDEIPCSGSAGGIGGAMRVLLNTEIQSGFDIVQHAVSLEEKIMQSDIVITGEGVIDEQTFYGKVPSKVVDIAHSHKKRIILIAGQIKSDARLFDRYGVVGYYSIMKPLISRRRAIQNAAQLLEALAYSVGKDLLLLDKKV